MTELYRRFPTAEVIDFGSIHSDAVAKLYREYKARPGTPYTKGRTARRGRRKVLDIRAVFRNPNR